VDFDLNNTASDDVFLATDRSLIVHDAHRGPGVSVTSSFGANIVEAYEFPEWQQGAGMCAFSNAVPTGTPTPPGDYVGVIRYNFKIMPPGSSRSVTLIYRAF
jgi:hypothetical protein